MRRFVVFVSVLLVVYGVMALVRQQRGTAQEPSQPLPDRSYSAAAFDSIHWENADAVARGKDVYSWVCARCHGPAGLGDGNEVIDGDTLHPPSFAAPDWRFASDSAGLYQRIYLGNNRGMPHWGEQGLSPRDVIAVGTYIRQELR